MINSRSQVRRVVNRDHHQIANLVFHEFSSHRHLDWYSPLDWIGTPNYWAHEANGKITAALACPEDPPHIAWIRFFGHSQDLPAAHAWHSLWQSALADLNCTNTQTHVASIITKQWFQPLLLSSGFQLKQNIVLLELKKEMIRSFPVPAAIQIRPMQDADLPLVAQLDLAAFGQFWHNTQSTLQRARSQCASATVAEDHSGLIGYQLSTQTPFGAHLARLAVNPQHQGRGIGSALISHLIQTLGVHQLERLSVNTQSDNSASLALYKKLGFMRTGEELPVFVYSIGG